MLSPWGLVATHSEIRGVWTRYTPWGQGTGALSELLTLLWWLSLDSPYKEPECGSSGVFVSILNMLLKKRQLHNFGSRNTQLLFAGTQYVPWNVPVCFALLSLFLLWWIHSISFIRFSGIIHREMTYHNIAAVQMSKIAGPWFNINMSSYQYRKSRCGDKTVVRSAYLHNGISYTSKMVSFYWIGPLEVHYKYTSVKNVHKSLDVLIVDTERVVILRAHGAKIFIYVRIYHFAV